MPATLFSVAAGTRLRLYVSDLVFLAGDHAMEVDGEQHGVEPTATDDFQDFDGVRYRRVAECDPEIRNVDNSIWVPDAPID
jgi:hypothetical protein